VYSRLYIFVVLKVAQLSEDYLMEGLLHIIDLSPSTVAVVDTEKAPTLLPTSLP
jgi:hypothetical protein